MTPLKMQPKWLHSIDKCVSMLEHNCMPDQALALVASDLVAVRRYLQAVWTQRLVDDKLIQELWQQSYNLALEDAGFGIGNADVAHMNRPTVFAKLLLERWATSDAQQRKVAELEAELVVCKSHLQKCLDGAWLALSKVDNIFNTSDADKPDASRYQYVTARVVDIAAILEQLVNLSAKLDTRPAAFSELLKLRFSQTAGAPKLSYSQNTIPYTYVKWTSNDQDNN